MNTRSSPPLFVAVGVIATVAILGLVFMIRGGTQPASIIITPASSSPPVQMTATQGLLHVYVSGQVRDPDVYELAVGSIIKDAILAAGGFTDQAVPEAVNLALPLADGMQVHVPATGDTGPAVRSGGIISLPTDLPGLLDVNAATAEQLDTLPGIGPATAAKIIEYRQANGPFQSVDDLIDVPGIGPAKLEGIRPLVSVN